MIKVVEVTFECKEEFNALNAVKYAIDAYFFQATKIGALVEKWHGEEYTEEARINQGKINLSADMIRLAQALDAFRALEQEILDMEEAK